MAVQFRDYYDVLDVARTATEDEIKQAYRRLARTYHPMSILATPPRKRSSRTRAKPTPSFPGSSSGRNAEHIGFQLICNHGSMRVPVGSRADRRQ